MLKNNDEINYDNCHIYLLILKLKKIKPSKTAVLRVKFPLSFKNSSQNPLQMFQLKTIYTIYDNKIKHKIRNKSFYLKLDSFFYL
ncbi:hypothetical protein SAMN05444148_1745 [Winogradskyella jejuensis]|uniref:Uncharacterized protein n=1 Tax=Winogradskyella jejuensis TaxID=1089305 RepID=A0A1M5S129_9FLAO|nr:hypothetical protein SAMN05444148_1745 [Winogradskyella jejuensis]